MEQYRNGLERGIVEFAVSRCHKKVSAVGEGGEVGEHERGSGVVDRKGSEKSSVSVPGVKLQERNMGGDYMEVTWGEDEGRGDW